jgi:hypothetical protein
MKNFASNRLCYELEEKLCGEGGRYGGSYFDSRHGYEPLRADVIHNRVQRYMPSENPIMLSNTLRTGLRNQETI